jgi:hypothetical protein
MSKTKLTGRENLTKCAFCLGPVGPTDKGNQVKMYKKYFFLGSHPLWKSKDPDPYQTVVVSRSVSNSRIKIRIKQSDQDPYRIEKQDPDPYQSEKQDPDQKGLDPQPGTGCTGIVVSSLVRHLRTSTFDS